MPASTATSSALVIVGQVTGLFGVKGWVKVFSHTEPRAGIAGYDPLYLQTPAGWRAFPLEDGREHGAGVILKFVGYDDRTAAQALVGYDIAIFRDQLPAAAPGEYYWTDLEGLRVVTLDGVELGTVSHLFATGANDVLVVKDAHSERERLLPFLTDSVIREVNLDSGLIRVDWDPDF